MELIKLYLAIWVSAFGPVAERVQTQVILRAAMDICVTQSKEN